MKSGKSPKAQQEGLAPMKFLLSSVGGQSQLGSLEGRQQDCLRVISEIQRCVCVCVTLPDSTCSELVDQEGVLGGTVVQKISAHSCKRMSGHFM